MNLRRRYEEQGHFFHLLNRFKEIAMSTFLVFFFKSLMQNSQGSPYHVQIVIVNPRLVIGRKVPSLPDYYAACNVIDDIPSTAAPCSRRFLILMTRANMQNSWIVLSLYTAWIKVWGHMHSKSAPAFYSWLVNIWEKITVRFCSTQNGNCRSLLLNRTEPSVAKIVKRRWGRLQFETVEY